MDTVIQGIYVSKEDFLQINFQSCDCSALIFDFGGTLKTFRHERCKGRGCMAVEDVDDFDRTRFSIGVDLTDTRFVFDGTLLNEYGLLDGVRFRFEDTYLFLFADENNLILTKSRCDLFDDSAAEVDKTTTVLAYKYIF